MWAWPPWPWGMGEGCVEVKGGVPESRPEARMLHGLFNAWLLELDCRNNLLKISYACEICTAPPWTIFFSICNFF